MIYWYFIVLTSYNSYFVVSSLNYAKHVPIMVTQVLINSERKRLPPANGQNTIHKPSYVDEGLSFSKRINGDRLCHRMLLVVEFDGIRYNDLMRVLSISCNLMEDAPLPRISKTGHVTRNNISLVILDLSYNMLDGQIPTEIFTMQYLLSLNLENNNLMGSLPRELGGMASLVRLDLSHNMLEGNIPSSLSALSLSWLDLSNNRFSGPIPEQGSLVTFPEYAFENNSGLCGIPLPPCNSSSTPNGDKSQQSSTNHQSSQIWWIALGLLFCIFFIIGLVIGQFL